MRGVLRRSALAALAGLLVAAVLPAIAHAAVSSGFAYVWASQPTTAAYNPPAAYSFNSTGGVNKVRRISTGRYEVDMPNLGVSGGVSHASAYGITTNTCQIGYNNWSGGTMTVAVYCFSGGVAADTMFTATFSNGPTTADTGYLFADQPSAASYTPSPLFQYNSSGTLNTIERLDVGYYWVHMPALDGRGDVQITAYGTTATRCSVGSWTNRGYPTFERVAFVHCVNTLGAPKDAMFMLTSVNFTGFLGRTPASHARVDPPAPLSTTPYSPYFFYNSTGGTNVVTRLGLGLYRVTMPGMPLSNGTVRATALSFGGERCNVAYWATEGVTVQCRDTSGAYYDSPFAIAFQG